jgi:Holliday junction resolvase-like predicted endonuclease
MGASRIIADQVAEEVENNLYEGISTNEILQMTLRQLRKSTPAIRHLLDLRKGLSLMDSKPEFESFVQILLAHNGFEVTPNRLVTGKCVTHEVDAVARKEGITYFVEAKHHMSYHNLTGLDESRIARAVLEDITEGFELGKTNLKIDRAMIVTNTRYSEYAIRYGRCRNILQIGWSSPANLSLQNMIEKKDVYPLSCLRGLKRETKRKLVNSGIVLIKQLFEQKTAELARKIGVPKETLKQIMKKAKNSRAANNF